MDDDYQRLPASARIDESILKPIKSILTPSSAMQSPASMNSSAQNFSQDESEAQSMLHDKEFFKATAIHHISEIAGREKSLLALRRTFKNIDKSE